MKKTNMDLFDEFNRVDAILRDMYSAEKGVTKYIDNMKGTSAIIAMKIPEWDQTLTKLIRVRGLRNNMAHNPGEFNYADTTEEDLKWLMEFHNDLLNRSDPLCKALAIQAKENARKNKKFVSAGEGNSMPAQAITEEVDEDDTPWWKIVIPALVVAAGILSAMLWLL